MTQNKSGMRCHISTAFQFNNNKYVNVCVVVDLNLHDRKYYIFDIVIVLLRLNQ